MIAVGLVLLILGLLFAVQPLFVIGIVLVLVGVVVNFVPMRGSTRRWY